MIRKWTIFSVFAVLLILKFECVISQCGQPKIRLNPTITKGTNTLAGEWPWHAAISHRQGHSTQYACGGTLLSRTFVLTAAHCTFDDGVRLTPRKIFVQLGVHNLQKFQGAQQLPVEKIHRHENFSPTTMANDIALLELGGEARFDEYVLAVCLRNLGDLSGEMGVTVGWGFTDEDALSNTLQKATLPVNNMLDCVEHDHDMFAGKSLRGLLCIGSRHGTSVCNGDSGGGIFFKRNGAWNIGGITSYTKQREDNTNLCSTNGYAAFTNVASYLDWIEGIAGRITEQEYQPIGIDAIENRGGIMNTGNSQPTFSISENNQLAWNFQSGGGNTNGQPYQTFYFNPGSGHLQNGGGSMNIPGVERNVFHTSNGMGQTITYNNGPGNHHTITEIGGPGNYRREESFSFSSHG